MKTMDFPRDLVGHLIGTCSPASLNLEYLQNILRGLGMVCNGR